MKRSVSEALYEKSKTYFPGGVNSPVRAFKSVDGSPLFIKKGNGAVIWDEDDNEFIDFCCSWGPLILGHNHPSVYQHIVDALGNVVYNEQIANGTKSIDVSNFKNGVYFVIIDPSDAKPVNRKLIIRH